MGKTIKNLKVAWPTFLAMALASSITSCHLHNQMDYNAYTYLSEDIPKIEVVDYQAEDTNELTKEIDEILTQSTMEEDTTVIEEQNIGGFSK